MQPAYLAAAFCAIGWLVTVVWWRVSAAKAKADSDAAWRGASDDRSAAITKAVALQKQLDIANADIDARAKSFYELERAAKRDAEALLAANKAVSDLKAASAAQRVENAALQADLDANSARMAALLDRLRTNVNATKPAPWKALAARLLQEYQA